MGPVRGAITRQIPTLTDAAWLTGELNQRCGTTTGVTVNDLLYIAITIVTFWLLTLLIKGVERFER